MEEKPKDQDFLSGSFHSQWNESKAQMISNYERLINQFGDTPEAIQMSRQGQLFRFAKLATVGNLEGAKVLDIGCGRADFFNYLNSRVCEIDYTGVDLVPELIEKASKKYPTAKLLCQDLFEKPLNEKFDYVFLSMVLNHKVKGREMFNEKLLKLAFAYSKKALCFNFVSALSSEHNPNAISYDPAKVFKFCVNQLSPHLVFHHHYERKDVAVFVYR